MSESNGDLRVLCSHARECGGCPLIDKSYPEQLERKRQRVRDAFALYPELASVSVGDVARATPVEGYRTRAKFAVGKGGSIGMYTDGHAVVDIPECRVISPSMRAALNALRAMARDHERAPLRALVASADGGPLRAVDLRSVIEPTKDEREGVRERLMLTLVLDRNRATLDDAREACEQLAADGVATVCAVSWHDGRSPQLLGAAPEIFAGPRAMRDLIGDGSVWLHASPGSFAQAHRGTSAAIHKLVRQSLEAAISERRRPRVLELFAGSGALGLSLSKAGMNVCLVESFAPASEAALDAAREQRLEGVLAFADDATRFAREEARRANHYDAVVVNPPRRGVDRAALSAIGALAPSLVVYVSCDPETLARDVAALREHGYAALGRANPFDMIPLTDEVETVVVLRRQLDDERKGVEVLHRDERIAVFEGGSGVRARAMDWARNRMRWRDCVAVAGAAEDESGLVVLARSSGDAAAIVREGIVSDLQCEAWVKSIARDKGSIERAAGRTRDARTKYKRLAVVGGHCKVRLVIERGDTGSARVHMAGVGHAVLGDAANGERGTNVFVRERMALDRTALHVSALRVRDGESVIVLAAKPNGDLALLEARLGRRESSAQDR